MIIKKKKSFVAIVFVVVVALLFSVFSHFNFSSTAHAETVTSSNSIESSKKISEQMIENTRAEYKNLVEYDYSPEILSAMEKTGKTVGESLLDQLCYYQGLLGETEDEEEKSKINHMIQASKNVLDMYQEAAKEQKLSYSTHVGETNTRTRSATGDSGINLIIATAIAWFDAVNYLLSGELLTHAWGDNFTPGTYVPIHGNRVVGSQKTYDFLNFNGLTDIIVYETYMPSQDNAAPCYEEDLGFALHGCHIAKTTVDSTALTITDTYDFDVQTTEPALQDLVAIFEEAQNRGLIINYELCITVDIADPLYIELESTNNGVHTLLVHNLSDEKFYVAYNTKMCLAEDAKTWVGLKDISSFSIEPHNYTRIYISENSNATHITFCHIKGGSKIITYADELYLNRSILNTTFSKTTQPIMASRVLLVAKVSNSWLVQLRNTDITTMRVEYNTKMCNELDATTWAGLKDINALYLAPNEKAMVTISENYSATHIAVRFVGDYFATYFSANNLSADGFMDVSIRTERIYPYLIIENKGKSGSTWNIKIINPTSGTITVYYNQKMCYYNDARDWTGLNDVVPISIGANGDKTVQISENWFASSIAISYMVSGQRLITYADGLTTSGGINVYNNIKG